MPSSNQQLRHQYCVKINDGDVDDDADGDGDELICF